MAGLVVEAEGMGARRAGPIAQSPEVREREFWRGVVRALMLVVELIRVYKLGGS